VPLRLWPALSSDVASPAVTFDGALRDYYRRE